MGGGDEPENLIELTIEEHAEAHRVLYEQHGHWQDMLAWKGLLGLISSAECAEIAIREGAKKGARIANFRRWGSDVIFKDDPKYVPYSKRQFGYSIEVDGRKVRSKRFWFNDGTSEGQFSLEDPPVGWVRGRLKRQVLMGGT